MSVFPLVRHLSVRVTPVLAKLPVHASHITAVSLLTGLASGLYMMQGDRTWGIIGGVLLVICYVLDNCDGEIARLKNQTSRLGMHFDTFVDAAVHTFFFAALGIGVRETTGEDAWLWLGWIAAAGSAFNYVISIIADARDRVADQRPGGSTGRERPAGRGCGAAQEASVPVRVGLEKADRRAQLATAAPVECARGRAHDPLAACEVVVPGEERRKGVALVAEAGDGEALGGEALGHGGVVGVLDWQIRLIRRQSENFTLAGDAAQAVVAQGYHGVRYALAECGRNQNLPVERL